MSNTISVNPTTGALTILGGVPLNSPQLPTFPLSVSNGGTSASTLTGIVKGNGTGAFTIASAGTDYLAPAGNGSALTGITAAQVGALPLPSGATVSGADLVLGGQLGLLGGFTFSAGGGARSISMGASDTAGDLSLVGRASVAGTTPGAVTIQGGAVSATAHSTGGAVNLRAADGTGSTYGAGGSVNLTAGTCSNYGGSGGNINLTAGISADNGTSGSVVIVPGHNFSNNVHGYIKFRNLPTSDPHVADALYTTAGALMVSAG